MKINIARVQNDINNICEFTATPDKGVTRFSYSDQDRKARDYLLAIIESYGLKITIDGVGNIIARLEAIDNEKPAVMIGSHLDTVQNGGKFDGLLGVIAALEVIRVIVENKYKLSYPLDLIIFAEEEGSNFKVATLGSQYFTGKITNDDLKKIKNSQNETAFEVLSNFNLNPGIATQKISKAGQLKAMIELHVEQGQVLDQANIPIGIVENIAGIEWLKISFKGEGNHAGATPMSMRKDPLVGAAHFIKFVEELTNASPFKTNVATVGHLHCNPNVANIINENVFLTVDIRDINPQAISYLKENIIKFGQEVSAKLGLQFSVQSNQPTEPVSLSQNIQSIIEKACINRAIPYQKINSFAVHDICSFKNLTELAMIFVPSIDGRSHVPQENTSYADIHQGITILLDTVLELNSS